MASDQAPKNSDEAGKIAEIEELAAKCCATHAAEEVGIYLGRMHSLAEGLSEHGKLKATEKIREKEVTHLIQIVPSRPSLA